MNSSPITRAIEIVGLQPMAKGLGVTYQAIRKWEAKGHLPRTEWTGETHYAQDIERMSGAQVTAKELLDLRPAASDASGEETSGHVECGSSDPRHGDRRHHGDRREGEA